MKCFFAGLLFFYCAAVNADANNGDFPSSFSATYELEKNGFSVAETRYTFKKNPQISFQSSTSLIGMASLFSNERIIESSMFETTIPASVKLIHYQFEQTGKKSKTINSTVNWQHQSISTIINTQAIPDTEFSQTIWDKHSAFLALMMLANENKKVISFNALDEGKVVGYVFNFIGTKEIELYDDEWKNTSVWQRQNSNKTLTFYLDPAKQNMPLKIEEHRNQTLRATLWLKELNWYE